MPPEEVQKILQANEEVLKMKTQEVVKEEIEKVEQFYKKKEAQRYRLHWNQNTNTNPDRKPGSMIPFSFLRKMAINYAVARACINRRIKQLTQLEYDVTTIDGLEKETGYESQIKMVQQWMKHPMGHKTRFREFINILVDDVLTLDALSFEIQRTRGGKFLNLIPVDPTTIVLLVTQTGGTPEPPQDAYAQYLQGEKVATFTTNEMMYESMANRSYTAYGLAPLESLILQVEAALRGTLYNLNYFRESNVPEGFITLPNDVASNRDQVEEWQMWFDMMMAGDQKMQHRLKILPGESTYTAAKKPEDMSFERFELWLLQQTCAVFDVQPQDIGITIDVNKATGQVQEEIGKERGLIPLSNFVKEILDDVIQIEFGFENLQFVWTNLNPADRKEEVEIAEKEINMGALSVDEYRQENGREPIGLGHYIKGKDIIIADDIINGKYQERQNATTKPDAQNTGKEGDPNKETDDDAKKLETNDDTEKMALEDLKKWRKVVFKCFDHGKPVNGNKFDSEYIDEETRSEIVEALKNVHSKKQARLLFSQYIDPEYRASLELLKITREMRNVQRQYS